MASSVISELDISLLDEFLLDDSAPGPTPPVVTDDIQFNGFGLQNENIITSQITYSAPQRDMSERAFPRAQGEYIETDYWRKTIITLRGTVKAASRVLLEQLMDEMRENLAVPNGLLRMPWGGAPRFWNAYATLDAMFASKKGNFVTFTPFEVSFLCPQPFGRAAARISFTPPTPCTASPTVYEIEETGTAPTDSRWTFSITTAGTCSEITLENDTTGEAITVAAAFVDGDTLSINGEEKTVLLNGSPIDYTGVFPTLAAGENSFSLQPNGTGFSILPTESHYPRYY